MGRGGSTPELPNPQSKIPNQKSKIEAGGGKWNLEIASPSPQPSPRSSVTGRGRETCDRSVTAILSPHGLLLPRLP